MANVGKLILMRCPESNDDALGLWSGIRNVSLSKKGKLDAHKFAEVLRDQNFDLVYYSTLRRAKQTLKEIQKDLNLTQTKIKKTAVLDERDLGAYTGKDKWKVRAEIGAQAWTDLRQGWDFPPPDGESLKDVSERVIPWYTQVVLPQLLAGKDIMLISHDVPLQTLRKYLENINQENVRLMEMPLGKIYIYTPTRTGRAKTRTTRQVQIGKTYRY